MEINDVIFLKVDNVFERETFEDYKIISIYDHDKITSLFNNSDTMSFLDLVVDYKKLLKSGYNDRFLNQSLHTMLSLPFFLFLMTAVASIINNEYFKKI